VADLRALSGINIPNSDLHPTQLRRRTSGITVLHLESVVQIAVVSRKAQDFGAARWVSFVGLRGFVAKIVVILGGYAYLRYVLGHSAVCWQLGASPGRIIG
jgi:hypothetical protein